MKPAIVFVAAFLVSTGASAGAKYAITPAPPAPKTAADSAKAANDSTHRNGAESGAQPSDEFGGGARGAAAQTDSAKPVVKGSTIPTTAGPTPSVVAKTPPKPIALEQAVARAIATENTPKDTATEGAERRVSKIFTSMDPKQAARVLEHMTDGDIHVILGYVGPRQAAAILAELNPERVAALSKLAMRPSKP